MRTCDWIAEYLYNYGVRNIYGLMGGGASGLNDGFIKYGKIQYRCFHHEQGAGHAAIGEAKTTGRLAVVNPTTGCGGTNCATSVLDAWQDSVPVLFISGNVKSDTCTHVLDQRFSVSLRKYGVQEHDITKTYASITKLCEFVESVDQLPELLNRAITLATTGRKGPVWLDIPSDIQTARFTVDIPAVYQATKIEKPVLDKNTVSEILTKLRNAERPVILAGYGIRRSNSQSLFMSFVEKYQLPFVSTYGARDLVHADHDLNIGAIGIKGSRAGNFAMQNADLLLILGCSLNSSHIGYDPKQFSPFSEKIYVDIDSAELSKTIVDINQVVHSDLRDFFEACL